MAASNVDQGTWVTVWEEGSDYYGKTGLVIHQDIPAFRGTNVERVVVEFDDMSADTKCMAFATRYLTRLRDAR